MATRVVVGIAGSGKTSYGMGIIEEELRAGLSWSQIGFCSFSRAACGEAAERAARLTGESVERLQKFGFFRTIHSCVLRCLGLDSKVIIDHDSAEGKKFLKECVGAARGGERGSLGQRVDETLSAWDFLRARLALLPDDRCDKSDSHAADRTSQSNHSDQFTESGPPAQTLQSRDPPQLASTAVDMMSAMSGRDRPMTGKNAALTSPQTAAVTGVTSGDVRFMSYYTGPKIKCADEFPRNAFARHPSSLIVTPIGVKDLGRDTQKRNASSCQKSDITTSKTLEFSTGSENWKIQPDITEQEKRALRVLERNRAVVEAYQREKELYGRLDFTDLLMLFTGIGVDEQLRFHHKPPLGEIPAEVEVWLIDEAQDCSNLLWRAAQRLSDCARDVYWLGDGYQSVYGFSGACAQNFEVVEREAELAGNRLLLNRSWRNPDTVLEWGEAVLRESGDYRERRPFGEAGEGSVGLVDEEEFIESIADLAATDTMVIARTWFTLEPVIRMLNESGIPWRSTSEDRSSRWECPAKIAYTLVMRDLMAGLEISEQDWRRVTETLPVKQDGVVLFERGAKARWKKAECRRQPDMRLDGLEKWGATPEFMEWVRNGKWRKDMPLLLDHAIERHGIDEVRKPSVRVGTCHAVKGAEAANVFCLSGSTERVLKEADPREETCLRYVAITRASQNYRLVVNRLDMQRGKPQFWAAPKGSNEWAGMPEMEKKIHARDRSEDSNEDFGLGENTERSLDLQVPSGNLRDDWSPGPAAGGGESVSRTGSQETQRHVDENAGTDDDATDLDWCKL